VIETTAKDIEAVLDRPFYSPGDAAEIAGVSTSTVLNYIRAGRLVAVRLSERTIRIPRRSLLKLLSPTEAGTPVRVPLDEIAVDRE
jgi:excisionase family DNA binding protein